MIPFLADLPALAPAPDVQRAVGYLVLIAWHRSDLGTLSNVPVVNLLLIVVGLPLAAAAGGWLLAGREPPAIARRPLD